MSGICPKMSGAQCAMKYCDLWNDWEQRCSEALESRKRVEILNMILDKAEELLADAKEKEDIEKVVRELNIINVGNTIQ